MSDVYVCQFPLAITAYVKAFLLSRSPKRNLNEPLNFSKKAVKTVIQR